MKTDNVVTKIMLIWLVIHTGRAAICDWRPVELDVLIPHDIETVPLLIKTDSSIGSGEMVVVRFYDLQGERAGRIVLRFSTPPQYYIDGCSTSWTLLPTNLPSERDKVWEITKTLEPRIVITCNGVEVVNVLLSDTTCARSKWSTTWRRDATTIQFLSSYDTASDYYCHTNTGTAAACDWTPVVREGKIPHDIEKVPLLIKTDSSIGSDERVVVNLYNLQGEWAGAVGLIFTSPPMYYIAGCTMRWTDLPAILPSEQDKIWEITKTLEPRIVITCNGVEVLNFLLSDTTCAHSRWSTYWRSSDIAMIWFWRADTASDYYCTQIENE